MIEIGTCVVIFPFDATVKGGRKNKITLRKGERITVFGKIENGACYSADKSGYAILIYPKHYMCLELASD